MPRPYEKIFILGGEASVFHEGLACACTGWKACATI